jgi:hypothetical protein
MTWNEYDLYLDRIIDINEFNKFEINQASKMARKENNKSE